MSAAQRCGHATVELPDPLPPAIAAALRLQVDTAQGRNVWDVTRMIGWSVYLTRLIGHPFNWTSATACAVYRRHPVVAEMAGVVDPVICSEARKTFELNRLPGKTDLGLAERVAALCSPDLAWSPDGDFRVWQDDMTWRIDRTGALAVEQVKTVVRRLLPREAEEAQRIAAILVERDQTEGKDPQVREAVAAATAASKFVISAQSARVMKAGVELLRGEAGVLVPAEAWDRDERLLTVANGTLELADGGVKLREHRREDRITRRARAAYRPEADRTEWDRFISHVLPDPAVRAYLQRLLGYALLGANPVRVLLLLVGPTSTGKSTLLEAIVHALGEYAGSFKLSLFRGEREGGKPRPDLHVALPRRLIVTTEASQQWQLDADQVKRLTGNDSDSARTVYAGDYREQRPAFLPVIATNSAPKIRDADAALWRRMVAVPFDVEIPKESEDGRLGERLREHADAVFAWVAEGFDDYMRLGGFGPVPQACTDAVLAVQRDMTLTDQWLADRTEAGDYTVPPADLAEDLHRWYLANRVDRVDQISTIALGKELGARGYRSGYAGPSGRRHRVWKGLRLRPDRDHVTDDESTDSTGHPGGCICDGRIGPIRPIRRGLQ